MRLVGMGLLAACVLAVSACEDDAERLAKAEPTAGEKLEDYSRNISRSVSVGNNADLVQRFCRNMSGAACAPDIAKQLEGFGYADNQTGVDMAYAFTLMAADTKDGTADMTSSDEDFLVAAYQVALARAPDEGGAQTNLAFIQETGERKAMLRSLLESQEFKSLP